MLGQAYLVGFGCSGLLGWVWLVAFDWLGLVVRLGLVVQFWFARLSIVVQGSCLILGGCVKPFSFQPKLSLNCLRFILGCVMVGVLTINVFAI